MSLISNFRVYGLRKYQENGEWKEEEIEFGQISQSTNLESISFYPYLENKPTANFRHFFMTQNRYEYASYKPGDMYIPKRTFSLYDLFTVEEFASFCSYIIDGFTKDYNKAYYDVIFASNVFWQTPGGFNIIPFFKIEFTKASYNINNDTAENIKRGSVYSLDFMATKIDQNLITYNGSNFYKKTDSGNVLMSLGKDYFYAVPTTSHGYCSGGPLYMEGSTVGYANIKEHQMGLTRFMNIITKIKIMPFWNFNVNMKTTLNGVDVFKNNYNYKAPETVEQTDKSHSVADSLSLVFDISNASYFPTSGFGLHNIRFQRGPSSYGYPSLGCVTRIDWSAGPESNNPDETDDPNDDDPGHGNGDDPDDKGGDGDHDNTSDIIDPPGIPPISATGVGLVSVYNPTSSQLAALGAKLWNPTALDAIKQYFANPMDTILGLSIVPVAPNTGVSKNIHLGIYDTEVSALLVDSDYVIINCGSIPINRYYGSYLDYDPYTKITCYLPYIGEIEVNPDQVMQKSLKILYYVNVITGDIVAMLCADGSIIYTVAGNCIRQLPMSQSDYSAIINTAVSAVSTIASAAVGASAAGAVGGTVAGAAKTSAGAAVAEARTSAEISNQVMGAGNSLINQVMSSKMRYNHAGSIGTGSGQLTYQTPYLTIERPNLDLADRYKSFVGYPCNKTMQLSRCTGFTQIEATKLSIPCATDEEITEILQFLVEGVII